MRAFTITINRVEELIAVGELLRGGYIFRGHGSSNWRLETTLERAADRWGVARTDLFERERTLLQLFQRRAHHYINDPPECGSRLEWTALLQHYRGPTRLLDVTESYLVATFFAVEKAEDKGIIWAFNRGPLSPVKPQICYIKECDAILSGEAKKPNVLLVQPLRLNRRLAAQQGAFLMPTSIEISFQDQLETVFKCGLDAHKFTEISPNNLEKNWMDISLNFPVVKIVILGEHHSEIMRFLSQVANITAATLFEDLEGFARSLYTTMRIYDF